MRRLHQSAAKRSSVGQSGTRQQTFLDDILSRSPSPRSIAEAVGSDHEPAPSGSDLESYGAPFAELLNVKSWDPAHSGDVSTFVSCQFALDGRRQPVIQARHCCRKEPPGLRKLREDCSIVPRTEVKSTSQEELSADVGNCSCIFSVVGTDDMA